MNAQPQPENEHALTILPTRPGSILPPPQAWQQMVQMATELYKSGLMPDGIKNSQAALATAIKGYELGVPFMAAVEGIHIIKGKATVGAHLILALIKRAHGGQAIRVAKTDNQSCTIEYREPGWTTVSSFTFTMDDARTAKLTGNAESNWTKYPAAMLRARAISAVGKLAFPEVVGGLYVAGELGDEVAVTDDGDVVPVVVETTSRPINHRVAKAEAPPPQEAEIIDAETGEIVPPASEPWEAPSQQQWNMLWALGKRAWPGTNGEAKQALLTLADHTFDGVVDLKQLSKQQISSLIDTVNTKSEADLATLRASVAALINASVA